MGLAHSPKIVTDGLVFLYDMGNPQKSWKGKPTTNYCYLQNPRIDSSYIPYVYTTSGSWQAKHPDAITVYNQAGTDISAYVNTGVGDWTNTYHAIWTYDAVLNKPVVTMRDLDGQWKAKSFGIPSMSSMGLTHGATYSISWLQWTTDITKCVWAGIYQRRSSDGAYNFWDGLSGDQGTSYNTVPYRWQRVYATFTVTAGMDLSVGLGLYMYGMYGPAGTLKISDVQLETGTASGFHNGETRSNTQALLDLTKRNTITATSLTYTADGTFSFDGSASNLTFTSTNLGNGDLPWTVSAWVKTTTTAGNTTGAGAILSNQSGGPVYSAMCVNSGKIAYWTYQNSAWAQKLGTGTTVNDGNWHLLTWVNYSNYTMDMYVDGVLDSNVPNSTSGNQNPVDMIGGSWAAKFAGSISQLSIYNTSLVPEEVRQLFDSQRRRYGV